MSAFLARHALDAEVAFGGAGARSAGELEALSLTLAVALPSGSSEQSVVLACTDRYLFAAGLLAAWSRGVSVALPPNGQPGVIHELVLKIDALTLLHDRDGGEGMDVRAFEAKAKAYEPSPGARLGLDLARDQRALIAYTSGSTGEPQAHDKSLAQLLDETAALITCFDLERARVLSAVPAQHIYGLLFGVLVPLLSGGALGRSSPLLPVDLLAAAVRERADVLVLVPPHLRALSTLSAPVAPGVRRVFSSGAPLPNDVASTLAEQGVAVTQVFGSTETGGIAYREQAFAPWQALPGVTCTRAALGALCVDSPWLSAKVSRPMQTQDRVELVSQGFLHLGRLDSVVKVAGRRVDLGDLEAALKRIEGVRDARVLSESGDAARGTTLLCVIEADGLRLDTVREQLRQSVDPVVIPKRMRIVKSLPRNATGKVTREALLTLFDTLTCPQRPQADGTICFEVPAQLAFLRGHFDGQPILPGVVQLHYLALAEARKRWPDLAALTRTSRVKFKRPVTPGETLTLTLSRKRANLVEFGLTVGANPASSGLLHFDNDVRVGAPHE